MASPLAEENRGVIFVEKSAPAEVIVGEEFDYNLKLTNLTKSTVKKVVLHEKLPEDFNLSGAAPKATIAERTLTWDVGDMKAGEVKTFTVRGTAEKSTTLINCAHVTFEMPQVCLSVRAVQPRLRIAKSAPAEVLQCDPIPYRLVVTNTGTGPAANVVVKDALPAGIKTLDGQQTVAVNVGTLAAGQSRDISIQAKASKPGRYANKATATAARGLTAESNEATTVVRKPELDLVKTGPRMRYVGRTATYTLTVTNKGDGEARDTILTDSVPAGTTFVSATDSGALAAGKVTWRLGSLAPKASKKVSMTLKLTQQGVIRNMAAAKAYCAAATAEAVTTVKGIPAILLECIDVDDPIEVGAKETYVITVTNQGSAVGTNILVECTLPDEQEFVSAAGPTKETTKAKVVTFAPLASLDPKAKATYRVIVKGTKAGDVRFKVTLKSDQMTSPAGETESTHIYAD